MSDPVGGACQCGHPRMYHYKDRKCGLSIGEPCDCTAYVAPVGGHLEVKVSDGDLASQITYSGEREGGCGLCVMCDMPKDQQWSRMYVCATCGNKRCPAAADCLAWECSGSNATNQVPVHRSDAPARQVSVTDTIENVRLTEDESHALFEALGEFATNSPDVNRHLPDIGDLQAAVNPVVESIIANRLAARLPATTDAEAAWWTWFKQEWDTCDMDDDAHQEMKRTTQAAFMAGAGLAHKAGEDEGSSV